MHGWRLSTVRLVNLGRWRAFPQLNLHSSSAAAGQGQQQARRSSRPGQQPARQGGLLAPKGNMAIN